MHIEWPLLQPIFIQRGIVSAAISERRTPHRLSLLFALEAVSQFKNTVKRSSDRAL